MMIGENKDTPLQTYCPTPLVKPTVDESSEFKR